MGGAKLVHCAEGGRGGGDLAGGGEGLAGGGCRGGVGGGFGAPQSSVEVTVTRTSPEQAVLRKHSMTSWYSFGSVPHCTL